MKDRYHLLKLPILSDCHPLLLFFFHRLINCISFLREKFLLTSLTSLTDFVEPQRILKTIIVLVKIGNMSTSVLSLVSIVSSKTLSGESIQILRLRNDHYSVKNGFRSISNTSYMSEDSLDSQETVEIPEYLESLETFKSLEINETTA